MRFRGAVVSAVVPLVLGLITLVAQGADGPVLFSDELAYLGMAVDFSAREAAVRLSEVEFYSPGYSLLLSPFVSLLGASPWAIAVGVNLVCLALLGPLLRRLLLEVLDVDRRTAAIAATLAACSPSIVLQVPRAWPEVALATLVAGWALCLARFVARRGVGDATATIVLALAAFTVHRRSVVLVVVSVVVILGTQLAGARTSTTGWRGRRRHLVAAGTTIALTATWLLLNRALDGSVRARLYPGADLVNANDRALELAREDVVGRVISQGWATVQATFGLVLLGLVVAVTQRRRGAPLTWPLALIVSTGGTLAVSAVAVADGPRVDHALYERYLAPVAVLSVALGLAGLLGRRRTSSLALLALPLSTALLLVSIGPDDLRGNVQKLTVPTLSSLQHLASTSSAAFLQEVSPQAITLLVLAVAALALGARRLGPMVGAAGVGIVFVAVVIGGSVLGLRPFLDHWEPYGRSIADAARSAGAERIGVLGEVEPPARTVLQYRLDYRPVVDVRGGTCPAVEHVIAAPSVEPPWPTETVARSTEPALVLYLVRC